MTQPRDRRQAIPSSKLPKALQPGRNWHITERFPAQYSLYENFTTLEGYHTVRPMFTLSYIEHQSAWVVWNGRLRLEFPDSYDPPFGIAEMFYDAAK